MPQFTQQEFITRIRDKYPQYIDLDDSTLYNSVIAKYPVYRDQIELGAPEPSVFTERMPPPEFETAEPVSTGFVERTLADKAEQEQFKEETNKQLLDSGISQPEIDQIPDAPLDRVGDVFKSAFNQSLTGMGIQIATGKPTFNLSNYEPNTMESIASTVVSFFMPLDLLTILLGGGIAGAPVRTAMTKSIQKLMVSGLSREAAEVAVRKGVLGLTARASSGFGGLGLYGAIGSAEAQKIETGEINAGDVFIAGMKSGITGAVAGAGGFVGQKVAGVIGELTLEIGAFGTVAPLLEGEVPTAEDYFHAAGVIIGIKGVNALGRGAPKTMQGIAKRIQSKVEIEGKSFESAQGEVIKEIKVGLSSKELTVEIEKELTQVEMAESKVRKEAVTVPEEVEPVPKAKEPRKEAPERVELTEFEKEIERFEEPTAIRLPEAKIKIEQRLTEIDQVLEISTGEAKRVLEAEKLELQQRLAPEKVTELAEGVKDVVKAEKPPEIPAKKEIVSKDKSIQEAYEIALSELPENIAKDVTIERIKIGEFPLENKGEGGRLVIGAKDKHYVTIEKGETNITETLKHELLHSYVLNHPELTKGKGFFGHEKVIRELEKQISKRVPVKKPTAEFIGYQEAIKGEPFALYNITGGKFDKSTVSAKTLKKEGIKVPETPPFIKKPVLELKIKEARKLKPKREQVKLELGVQAKEPKYKTPEEAGLVEEGLPVFEQKKAAFEEKAKKLQKKLKLTKKVSLPKRIGVFGKKIIMQTDEGLQSWRKVKNPDGSFSYNKTPLSNAEYAVLLKRSETGRKAYQARVKDKIVISEKDLEKMPFTQAVLGKALGGTDVAEDFAGIMIRKGVKLEPLVDLKTKARELDEWQLTIPDVKQEVRDFLSGLRPDAEFDVFVEKVIGEIQNLPEIRQFKTREEYLSGVREGERIEEGERYIKELEDKLLTLEQAKSEKEFNAAVDEMSLKPQSINSSELKIGDRYIEDKTGDVFVVTKIEKDKVFVQDGDKKVLSGDIVIRGDVNTPETTFAGGKQVAEERRKGLAYAHILQKKVKIEGQDAVNLKKEMFGIESLKDASNDEINNYNNYLLGVQKQRKVGRVVTKEELKESIKIEETESIIKRIAGRMISFPKRAKKMIYDPIGTSKETMLNRMGEGGKEFVKLFKESEFYHRINTNKAEAQLERLYKKIPHDEIDILRPIIEQEVKGISQASKDFAEWFRKVDDFIFSEGKKYINPDLKKVPNHFPLVLKEDFRSWERIVKNGMQDEVVDHVWKVLNARTKYGQQEILEGPITKEVARKYVQDFLENYSRRGMTSHMLNQVFANPQFKHSYPIELHRDRIFPDRAYENDVSKVLHAYIDGSFRAIGQAKYFEKATEIYSYEKVDKLLKKIRDDGYDYKNARDMMAISLRIKHPTHQEITSLARNAATFLLSIKTTIKNPGDLNKAFAISNTPSVMKAIFRQYIVFDKADRQLTRDILGSKAVFFQSLEEAGISGKFARLWTDKVIQFTKSEALVRKTTALSTVHYAERLLFKYKPGKDTRRQIYIKRRFKEWGIDPNLAKLRGKLTEKDKLRIGHWAIMTTQPTSPIDKPYAWDSNAAGQIMTIYKPFGFKSLKFVKDFALKELRMGNPYPLLRWFVWGTSMQIGINELTKLIFPSSVEDEDYTISKILEDFAQSGHLGFLSDMMFAVKFAGWNSPVIGMFFGPIGSMSITTAESIFSAINKIISGEPDKTRALRRQLSQLTAKRVPFIGEELHKEFVGGKKKSGRRPTRPTRIR